jgi:hypothetical protein
MFCTSPTLANETARSGTRWRAHLFHNQQIIYKRYMATSSSYGFPTHYTFH